MSADLLRRSSAASHRREPPSRQRRRATSATELVLVLPLLVIIASGTMDLGRSVHAGMIVANAARSGAECGATHRFAPLTMAVWEARIRTAVIAELSNLRDFDENLLQLDIDFVELGDDHDLVRVTVSHPVTMQTFLPGADGAVAITRTVSMRQVR
ncbi:MAG: pilus assembly protein [Planctomyces sp.]|nr:pilus assembly protein [Planctomyces sp.]